MEPLNEGLFLLENQQKVGGSAGELMAKKCMFGEKHAPGGKGHSLLV